MIYPCDTSHRGSTLDDWVLFRFTVFHRAWRGVAWRGVARHVRSAMRHARQCESECGLLRQVEF